MEATNEMQLTPDQLEATALELKRAYHRKWAEEHREQLRATQRRWKEKNREKQRAYQNKWQKEHPEKVKEYHQRYWQKKAAEMLAGANTDHN